MYAQLILLFVMLAGSANSAVAGFVALPNSRHHQFTTYGLFIEEGDSGILIRNASRAWGAIGFAVALLEAEHWKSRPQLVMHGSANAGWRINDRVDTLLTETFDARFGANIEFNFTPSTRFLMGWTHQSGHISDDVEDRSLIGPNLGNEILQFRIVHDWNRKIRVGGSFRPVVGSEPKMKYLGGNQFIEWFPWGAQTNIRTATPFITGSVEEYGVTKIRASFHAQAGVYYGSHYDEEHHAGVRLVIGYYNGIDPRLKYAQYKLETTSFGYAGVQLSL